MSANNQAVIIGRAGNNVSEDVRHLQSGMTVAELRLAVNRPTRGANGDPVTDWITCQFWDKNAQRLSEFVKKGDLISVSGSIRVDSWEKEGEKRTKVYIHGENFQMLESRAARESRGPVTEQKAPQGRAADPAAPSGFDDFDDEFPPF